MRLAVADPLPMYREGVIAVLSAASYPVEAPDDLLAWSRHRSGIILLTLAVEADWDLLRRLGTGEPELGVIAVLPADSPGLGVRAVRAGARSVMPRHVSSAALRRTVEATIDGQAVLPVPVAVALAAGPGVRSGPALSEEQLGWLRRLASGMTVANVAQTAGYSERAMFRLLQTVYHQVGARNRMQAILNAQREGLL